jgi:WD40 repeat protein
VCGAAVGPDADLTEVIAPPAAPVSDTDTVAFVPLRGVEVSSDETLATGEATFEVVPPEELQVPGYEILEEIGRGGMGVVYKARQVALNRPVALKMVLAGMHAGPREMARFNREAEAVARLQHPGIVQIYDVGEHEGRPFLALEYLDGGSLAEHLQGQQVAADLAAGLVLKLARAVHYAHEHGIVHRDLKPGNVLLSRRPEGNARLAELEPRITDFGVAKWLGADQGHTQSGTILGTPSYMAPEQASGKNRQITPAADIYALGAILYELVTGRPPFAADSPVQTMLLLVSEEPSSPRALAPRCPRDLETVCLKCLQKNPGKRYATAAALADDLERFLRREPIQARRATARERAGLWVRRRPLTAACLLLLALALAGAAAFSAPTLYRLAANQGQLVLVAPVEGVHVRVQPEHGDAVTVAVDSPTLLTLQAGEYRLTLVGGPPWMELSEEQLTLTRNGQRVVKVRPVPEGEIARLEGHTGSVHGLAVSPDGRLLLSASGFPEGDETLRLWDLKTGRELRRFEGHRGQVLCVAFSPDGKWAASGGTDKAIHLWDVETGQGVCQYLGHTEELSALAFSADSRRLLSGSHDGTVRLWDVDSGKQIGLFDDHTGMVTWVAFLPPGTVPGGDPGKERWIVSSAHDHTIRVWDLESGRELRRMVADGQVTECVAVSPDGRLAAAPGFDRCIRIWDLHSGRLVRRLLGHTNVVGTVAFSPDGRYLVSGSMDRTVRLWDVAAGAEVYCFEGHGDGIRAVAFTPDGRRIVSGGGGNMERQWVRGNDFVIRVWGMPHDPLPPAEPPALPAAEVHRFEVHGKGVIAVATSPDGRRQVSSGTDRTLRLWDLVKKQETGRLAGHDAEVWGLAWSADGRSIVTGGDDGTVRRWDARTGRELVRCKGHQARIWGVAVSADGRHALTAGQDQTVRLWDLVTGQELCRSQAHTSPVRQVALTPDGRDGLSASGTVVGLWDFRPYVRSDRRDSKQLSLLFAAGPKPFSAAAALFPPEPAEMIQPLRLLAGHKLNVQCLAISADGRRALSGGHDRTVRVWDLESGQEERRFEGHSNVVECLTLSADGRRVLSGSWDGVAICWEPDSGREVSFCAAHVKTVTTLAFAPGGRFLSSSYLDPVFRLWQIPDPDGPPPASLEVPLMQPPARVEGEEVRFTGHRNPVLSVAVSSDGRTVLTGSGSKYADGRHGVGAENEMRLWDAKTGQELRRFVGHTGAIFRVVYSSDGRRAASAGADHTVRLWELSSGRQTGSIVVPSEVRGLAWAARDRQIVVGGMDGVLRVFDAATGSAVDSPLASNLGASIWALALSPDRRQVAVAAGRELRLGDLESGRWEQTFTGHTDAVRDVFFSADGKGLISAGHDGTIRQWDVATGRQRRPALTQKAGIICMAIAPDGRHAATGGYDGLLRLWDLREGKELSNLAGHDPFPHGLAFSPDDKHLVSGGFDKTARVWRFVKGAKRD